MFDMPSVTNLAKKKSGDTRSRCDDNTIHVRCSLKPMNKFLRSGILMQILFGMFLLHCKIYAFLAIRV